MTTSNYTITTFVEKLRDVPDTDFSDVARITKFLATHPVDPGSLAPYLLWDRQHHTRNLIDRTPVYELVAICWESGQLSAIHDHQDQHCWMIAPIGRLMVQNYRVIMQDLVVGKCVVEKAEAVPMHSQDPQAVNPRNPVHRVYNPREFNERGVSLHIYSRPIDHCIVYSEETQNCGLLTLSYTNRRTGMLPLPR